MEWISEWWSSLDVFTQILYCVSIPSTLILIIQTILIIVGFGGSGPDVNVSDTSGFDVGGTDFDIPDGGDLSADVSGGDVVNPSDVGAMHLFTFQGIITFLTVFSWSGIITYLATGNIPIALIVGFLLGVGAMFGVAKLIQLSAKLTQNGNINVNNFLGETGTVYLVIPANQKGHGKINVTLGERYEEFDAVTEGDEDIPNGASVRITDIRTGNIMVVEKV